MKSNVVSVSVFILLLLSSTNLALPLCSVDEQRIQSEFVETLPIPLPSPSMWMKTFGGSESDSGWSVQQTTDGGYIITGEKDWTINGGGDIWLIKTDSNGNMMWDGVFGGAGSDAGRSVQQTRDGGYIITGYTGSFGAVYYDLWLIKTDKNGHKEWDRIFGGSGYEEGSSVMQTSDDGYILLGFRDLFGASGVDFWLIKTDKNGNKVWERTFGGLDYDYGYSVQQTKDGGYILTGSTGLFGVGMYDVWLVKTNRDGMEEWNKTFGGTSSDIGWSVQQTTDDGYIIIGETKSFGMGETDVWLIKTDNTGNKTWDRTFGGSSRDGGYSVQQTSDTGYIITGYINSSGSGEANAWLIKTNGNGTQEWDSIFGGANSDCGTSVQQTTDSGFIITGFTGSSGAGYNDVWLIKTDSHGKAKVTSVHLAWFDLLFQRFPYAFPLLRHLMGY